MPELPDVEMQRRYLEATSMCQRIESVTISAPAMLDNTTPRQLSAALDGHEFEVTRRHGKYAFAGLDGGKWLMLHFGMDGGLAYLATDDAEPRYTRMLIHFENGRLAYVSIRKLGKIGIAESVEQFVAEKRLGSDALDVSRVEFERIVTETRAMAKAALLDQCVIAGIGNLYADEILFQAGISPRRPLNDLSKTERARVFRVMKRILRRAIALDADSRSFPASWFIFRRRPGAKCPRCGGEVARTMVAGRTTYFCPACQV